MYNSKLEKSSTIPQKVPLSLSKTHGFSLDSSIDPELDANRSAFKIRDSSTGGKLPIHGPRRMVCPSRVLNEDFIFSEPKFKVLKSEISNYKAICALSKSHHSK